MLRPRLWLRLSKYSIDKPPAFAGGLFCEWASPSAAGGVSASAAHKKPAPKRAGLCCAVCSLHIHADMVGAMGLKLSHILLHTLHDLVVVFRRGLVGV